MRRAIVPFALAAGLAVAAPALAQVRVVTWNISNYAGGRNADLATCFYGSFQGRSMNPDVVMVQEVLSQSAANNLVTILNTALASTGDTSNPWAAAPFSDGPDTDTVTLYRTDRVQFLTRSLAVAGGNTNGAPRDVWRETFRIVGYTSGAAEMALYSVHMKAGDSSTDQTRRNVEANAIRSNIASYVAANPLAAFIVAGDFNIQSSAQAAYQTLITGADTTRVNDPIATPGSWNNNGTFRFVHTQDPAGAGGMDDRHDQLLLSSNLLDNAGLDYIGSPSIPYSTTTWNDPNHSYRSYGNDGSSYNLSLTVANNQFVGPAIAQALINVCAGAGHLPVFLDLRVPAKAAASVASLNLGDLTVGDPASASLVFLNSADVARFKVQGIATLNYTVSISGAGFSTPTGPFSDPADTLPADGNTHTVSLNTSAPGPYTGTLTFSTNAPDQPTISIPLSANVYCPADLTRDFSVDLADFFQFFNCYDAELPCADIDGQPGLDLADFFFFFNAYDAEC